MVSKRAAEFLAAEVRNIAGELESLDAEIRETEAKREAVKIKLDLLKQAIGPDFQVELPLSREEVGEAIRAEPPATGAVVGESAASEPPSAGGFRAEIRNVLAEATRGMRPKDVHEALVKRGVPFTGKVEPIARTYNELWRMAQKGQLRKRAGLYYPAQPDAVQ